MSYIEFPNGMCSNHTFDEQKWVTNIRKTLEEEMEDDDFHVSIFNVPQTLKLTHMNSYTPQLVALGPYHYWRPELQEMERYKVLSSKRAGNQNIKLNMIVDRLILLESRIRACYHRELNVNGETLAWMMVINACFLLEVITAISIKEWSVLTQVSSSISRLSGCSSRKLAQDGILRDIFMLENQIPLFVLKEVLKFQLGSLDLVENRLISILRGLYEDISPIKNDSLRIQSLNYQHILDLFYQTLVPKLNEGIEIESIDDEEEKEEKINHECKCLASLRKCVERFPFDLIVKLPLIFVSNFPGFTILKSFLDSKQNNNKGDINSSDNKSNSNQSHHSPLLEEIMIPSISELSNSGVMFLPTNGDIMTINFDIKARKFYLPTISLDLNSEILLRNLVAYEASMVLGPLVFGRYIELMNGMIDTKDDVKLLRERGIVLNYLKSDEDVANLWNGMSKSIRITRVGFLDQVIKNVNEYYQRNWKVRMRKFVKTYATNSWHFVTIVFAIVFLSFILFQVFCSFLYCFRIGGSRTIRS